MAALFKENGLCTRNGVCQPPGSERSHVHVIASVDDERREFKISKLWAEIEIGCGLADCFAHSRLESEIAHAAHVCVAFLRGIKDHAEMIAQPGARGGFC